MSRLLQILLGAVILLYLFQGFVLGLSIPVMYSPKAPTADGHSAEMHWKHQVKLGPMVFARTYQFDTTLSGGKLAYLLGMERAVPAMKMENQYYVMDKSDTPVKVIYDPALDDGMLMPVSKQKFYGMLTLSLSAATIFLALLIYMGFEIFRFASESAKGKFFTLRNKKRFRILGSSLLLFGLLAWIFSLLAWPITGWVTGYRGAIMIREGSMLTAPLSLVAGLLLLIIAEAFGKGLQIQTEQDYTI